MRTSPRPSFLRATAAKLGIFLASGLAALLALSPAALAVDTADTEPAEPTGTSDAKESPDVPAIADDDTETTDDDAVESTDEPVEEPGDGADEGTNDEGEWSRSKTAIDRPEAAQQEGASSERKAKVEASAVEPDFGYTKFRVGVQIEDGSYVPSGTSTLGSTITIVETIPGDPETVVTTTCTTTIGPEENGATFCDGLNTEGGPVGTAPYLAAPGSTITVTQTGVNDGLLIADGVKTVVPEPCGEGPIVCYLNSGDVVLTDVGLPPEASNDTAATDENESVTIDVLDNDDTVNGAPVKSLKVTSGPSDGSTTVTGSGNSRRIRYTPDSGFTGKDSFEYALTTPNGTATATVTVTVRPVPAAADAVLPDTGGSDLRWAGLGLMLVAGGGWLTAQGRRTRRSDLLA